MTRNTQNKQRQQQLDLEEESKAAVASAHTAKPKQVLKCVVTGCNFATEALELEAAIALMNLHAIDHQLRLQAGPPHPPQQPVTNTFTPRSAPKLERPKLNENATNEEWNMFHRRWCTYRTGSNILDDTATMQLLECCSNDLGDTVLRAHPTFTTKTIDEALTLLKTIAVVPVALGVLRAELTSMYQGADEKFRTFAARVQGKAETCEFITDYEGACSNCTHPYSGKTYYTTEYIRDVLLNGIADNDIRREALSVTDMSSKSVNDIIAFVETRETARDANKSSGINAVNSSYRQNQRRIDRPKPPNNTPNIPSQADREKTSNCPDCSQPFQVFSRSSRGWNKKPHTHCLECWRKNFAATKDSNKAENNMLSVDSQFGQISVLSTHTHTRSRRRRKKRRRALPSPEVVHDTGEVDDAALACTGTSRPKPKVILSHHIFTKGAWRRARVAQHPRTPLKLSPEHAPEMEADVDGLADSGAQSDVWGLDEYRKAGYLQEDLCTVSLTLNAANKSSIRIDGAFFTTISGKTADGSTISCKSMVYVSRDVHGFFLSYSTMLNLGMLSPTFPTPGCALPPPSSNISSIPATPSKDEIECTSHEGGSCREEVPEITELPFPCTPENNQKMKEWLIEKFSKSTFNKCPHHPIPTMSGPPLEIHLNDHAKPYCNHKANPVPIHWQEKVHEDLLRDEKLGVIERVPYGEPVEWCHRMVITRKHDGTPRRTVDLSHLNKQCRRETHTSESPFHVA